MLDHRHERRAADRAEGARRDDDAHDPPAPLGRDHVGRRDPAQEGGAVARAEDGGGQEQAPQRLGPDGEPSCSTPDRHQRVSEHEPRTPAVPVHHPPYEQGAAGDEEVVHGQEDAGPALLAGQIGGGDDGEREPDRARPEQGCLGSHEQERVAPDECRARVLVHAERVHAR